MGIASLHPSYGCCRQLRGANGSRLRRARW